MPLTHKQKKSAVVVCEADNLYTYTPASFPANVTFAMQVASDPLSGELSALLAVSKHQVRSLTSDETAAQCGLLRPILSVAGSALR